MIARVGFFDQLTESQEVAQRENWDRRFKSALLEQSGLVAVLQCRDEGGRPVSFSIWEDVDAMAAGGARANAVPLLPGQVGEDIPSPSRVEVWTVIDWLLAAQVEPDPAPESLK